MLYWKLVVSNGETSWNLYHAGMADKFLGLVLRVEGGSAVSWSAFRADWHLMPLGEFPLAGTARAAVEVAAVKALGGEAA